MSIEFFSEIFFNRNLDNLGLGNECKSKKIERLPNDNLIVNYEINSYGFRGKEFDGTSEILVLGCSQTFGSGMQIEYTWADILCNNLQKTYSNLACLGDSVDAQVYKAFKYFEEFGNPKVIVACFPLLRISMPRIPSKFKKTDAADNSVGIEMAYLYEKIFSKFSKSPHDPEAVLPAQVAVLYSFMFIQILEQYCRSNNIKFIWSIWDSRDIMNFAKINVPSIFKNYVIDDIYNYDIDPNTGNLFIHDEKTILNCHTELNKNPLFSFGADWAPQKDEGHWGIHMNLHVSEIFKKTYDERIKND